MQLGGICLIVIITSTPFFGQSQPAGEEKQTPKGTQNYAQIQEARKSWENFRQKNASGVELTFQQKNIKQQAGENQDKKNQLNFSKWRIVCPEGLYCGLDGHRLFRYEHTAKGWTLHARLGFTKAPTKDNTVDELKEQLKQLWVKLNGRKIARGWRMGAIFARVGKEDVEFVSWENGLLRLQTTLTMRKLRAHRESIECYTSQGLTGGACFFTDNDPLNFTVRIEAPLEFGAIDCRGKDVPQRCYQNAR